MSPEVRSDNVRPRHAQPVAEGVVAGQACLVAVERQPQPSRQRAVGPVADDVLAGVVLLVVDPGRPARQPDDAGHPGGRVADPYGGADASGADDVTDLARG